MIGKKLNFDDERSKLFFDFVRLLKEIKPKYWMLENVRMAKAVEEEISKLLGCEPIKIDSALVSGQKRFRLYWTNIPNVGQPADKGITGKSLLDDPRYEIATTENLRAENLVRLFAQPVISLTVLRQVILKVSMVMVDLPKFYLTTLETITKTRLRL